MKDVIYGLLIPFVGTSAGAACVFFMRKELKIGVQRALSGFAVGVLVAASIWSLIMSHPDAVSPLCIAELGCGGGRNARELLQKYPQAKLSALDYSDESVTKARKTNKRDIASGRCRVVQGNVDFFVITGLTGRPFCGNIVVR